MYRWCIPHNYYIIITCKIFVIWLSFWPFLCDAEPINTWKHNEAQLTLLFSPCKYITNNTHKYIHTPLLQLLFFFLHLAENSRRPLQQNVHPKLLHLVQQTLTRVHLTPTKQASITKRYHHSTVITQWQVRPSDPETHHTVLINKIYISAVPNIN
jgi:hypothetical protein